MYKKCRFERFQIKSFNAKLENGIINSKSGTRVTELSAVVNRDINVAKVVDFIIVIAK